MNTSADGAALRLTEADATIARVIAERDALRAELEERRMVADWNGRQCDDRDATIDTLTAALRDLHDAVVARVFAEVPDQKIVLAQSKALQAARAALAGLEGGK